MIEGGLTFECFVVRAPAVRSDLVQRNDVNTSLDADTLTYEPVNAAGDRIPRPMGATETEQTKYFNRHEYV